MAFLVAVWLLKSSWLNPVIGVAGVSRVRVCSALASPSSVLLDVRPGWPVVRDSFGAELWLVLAG